MTKVSKISETANDSFKNMDKLIKSIDILNEINLFRKQKGNNNVMRYSDFKDILFKEFDRTTIPEIVVKPNTTKGGRPTKMYWLTAEQTMQILTHCKVKPTKDFCINHNLDSNIKIVSVKTRFETSFWNMLTPILSELNLSVESQYRVGKYRIDFYIPKLNIAIEYDEAQHYYMRNIIKDKQREEYIKDKLGCKFIRVSYKNDDATNVGIVLSKIFKVR